MGQLEAIPMGCKALSLLFVCAVTSCVARPQTAHSPDAAVPLVCSVELDGSCSPSTIHGDTMCCAYPAQQLDFERQCQQPAGIIHDTLACLDIPWQHCVQHPLRSQCAVKTDQDGGLVLSQVYIFGVTYSHLDRLGLVECPQTLDVTPARTFPSCLDGG